MSIQNAVEARDLFHRSSGTLETILRWVGESAEKNMLRVCFDGWPSDEVVAELRRRGFRVELKDVLTLSTEVWW